MFERNSIQFKNFTDAKRIADKCKKKESKDYCVVYKITIIPGIFDQTQTKTEIFFRPCRVEDLAEANIEGWALNI